jgi:DNA-binding transcriptional MerR regulator
MMDVTYTISELATEFDITPRAIRFYADQGLLSPTRSGNSRVYTHRERTRLKLTLRGKRLGLSLQEIKDLVVMYETPQDTVPQLKKFLTVLAAHRAQLAQQQQDIADMLDELTQHETKCKKLLKAAS